MSKSKKDNPWLKIPSAMSLSPIQQDMVDFVNYTKENYDPHEPDNGEIEKQLEKLDDSIIDYFASNMTKTQELYSRMCEWNSDEQHEYIDLIVKGKLDSPQDATDLAKKVKDLIYGTQPTEWEVTLGTFKDQSATPYEEKSLLEKSSIDYYIGKTTQEYVSKINQLEAIKKGTDFEEVLLIPDSHLNETYDDVYLIALEQLKEKSVAK